MGIMLPIKVLVRHVVGHFRPASVALTFVFFLYRYCDWYCFVTRKPFSEDIFCLVNPSGVPHWRVKSSGFRQSKIYKCHDCAYGQEGLWHRVVSGEAFPVCVPHRGFLVFRIGRCHRLPGISVFRAFMPATYARPTAGKINLMDCSCLCREVEVLLGSDCSIIGELPNMKRFIR